MCLVSLGLAVTSSSPAHAQWEIRAWTCEDDGVGCKTEADRERYREKQAAREAAAAAARAAAERKAAERRAFTDKFGSHRSAEAERLQKMREAAGLPPPSTPTPTPSQCPAKYMANSHSKDSTGRTEGEARAKVEARRAEISCGTGGAEGLTVKPIVCRAWTGSCTVDLKTGAKHCPNAGYMCSLPYSCRVKAPCPQGASRQ